MDILEFGNKANQSIILIHGFQCPYQIWNKYIEHYKNQYHIIVPILEGHNPDKKEEFISLQKTAKEIEDYYISHFGNGVYAMFAISYGGIIAANIWQNQKLNIKKLIFDGSPITSYPRFLKSYLTNFYLQVTHKTQKRDQKTLAQAANSICPKEHLNNLLKVLDNMSDENIQRYIDAWSDYRLPDNINTPDTKVYFFHGTKSNEMLAKKSAKYVKKHYPNSEIICLKGKGHCETSLFEPMKMIGKLDKILAGESL